MPETITGVLEKIVYANDEDHFTIGELRLDGRGKAVTVTGRLPGVQCGETLELTGDWSEHPQHGKQFKFSEFRSTLPSSVHGIRKYLGSGLVHGIGPKFADAIVDKFGQETLRIISEESGRLREVPGVGAKRAKEIKAAWDDQSAQRELMVFLQTYGVGTAMGLRLLKQYGVGARRVLENEPYRVAQEITGIGFKTADRIAKNLGLRNESEQRVDAGILFALDELAGEGHTAVPVLILAEAAAKLLEVDESFVWPRMRQLAKDERLRPVPLLEDASPKPHALQLPHFFRQETVIADSVFHLLNAADTLPSIDIPKALHWAESRLGFTLAEGQRQAVDTALRRKIALITGGPGTGKTTILRCVVDILTAKKVRLGLAAPTGRAAQRLAEAAGTEARTIHRLLDYDPVKAGFKHDADNPLKLDFLIIDETSMLDTRLAAALLRAVPATAHLLLVGDPCQLPSVGAGNILADLIQFLPHQANGGVARLDQVFRQSERSGIVTTAHSILAGAGSPPHLARGWEQIDPDGDFHFLEAPADQTPGEVIELIRRGLPRWFPGIDVIRDVQVLPPMHRGPCGIGALNKALQEALNPNGRGFAASGGLFQEGDKVIQLRNNYDKGVFNGDLGIVREVNAEARSCAVEFDGDIIDFDRGELGELALAYAISIHKSQGSEFPVVILPLVKAHFVMLQRNLLYTGITRGRKKVFLIGESVAYRMAVQNREATLRRTDLLRKLLARG